MSGSSRKVTAVSVVAAVIALEGRAHAQKPTIAVIADIKEQEALMVRIGSAARKKDPALDARSYVVRRAIAYLQKRLPMFDLVDGSTATGTPAARLDLRLDSMVELGRTKKWPQGDVKLVTVLTVPGSEPQTHGPKRAVIRGADAEDTSFVSGTNWLEAELQNVLAMDAGFGRMLSLVPIKVQAEMTPDGEIVTSLKYGAGLGIDANNTLLQVGSWAGSGRLSFIACKWPTEAGGARPGGLPRFVDQIVGPLIVGKHEGPFVSDDRSESACLDARKVRRTPPPGPQKWEEVFVRRSYL